MLTIVISIFSALGIGSLIGGFVYIGRKLQVLDDLKEAFDELKVTTGTIKDNLKVVTDHLIRTDKTFSHADLKNYSPLQLSKGGQSLIHDLGFEEIFAQHKGDFFDYIDGEEPKLKYDVEAAAIKSMYVLSDADYMKPLKIFFYNNPERSLQNTAPTLGVYVRDKYLAEHPEITE